MNTNSKKQPTRILSISPVTISTPNRIIDLQFRVAVPMDGKNLPLILLSHGHGASNNLASLNGNLPLIDYWASQGFAVIQPTHLNSQTLKLPKETPGWPLFWRERLEDMKFILDQLDSIEALLPTGAGTFDRERIVAAGTSFGSHTVAMLLGAQQTDAEINELINLSDARVKAGIMMSSMGGNNFSDFVKNILPFYTSIDFSTMTSPALVFYGDNDVSPELTDRGADWHADPYLLSPSPKALVNMVNCGHYLGGVIGYDAAQTTDENPEKVALLAELSVAYLKTILYAGDNSWQDAAEKADPNLAIIESK